MIKSTDMKLKEIGQVCDIATSSVHRTTSQKSPDVLKKKRASRGRKRKLSLRQERLILRSIPVLREREGSFTSKRLIQYNRIHGITDRTQEWLSLPSTELVGRV